MKLAWVVLAAFGVGMVLLIGIVILAHQQNEAPEQPAANAADIESMTPLQRNCYGMWLKYSGVKISDLTVQQTRGIQSCESLGLFHDR